MNANFFGRLLANAGKAVALAAGALLWVSASAQTVTYFHNDASGTPLVATDASGNVVWKENYRPYGDKLNNQAASSRNRIGFAGRPYDGNTGLSYMGARYYDPVVGRFTGMDSAEPEPENVHSLNRYAYANNNPYRYVDPDGNTPLDVVFLMWDLGKLGIAVYSGNPAAIAEAGTDVGLSLVGVVSPVPGTGQAIKASRAAARGISTLKTAEHAVDAGKAGKTTAKELREAGRAEFDAARTGKLAENGGKCTYCSTAASKEVDHVKSLKSYADDVNAGKLSKADAVKRANAPQNLAGSCVQCNRGPGGKHAKELSREAGKGKWQAPNGFYKE